MAVVVKEREEEGGGGGVTQIFIGRRRVVNERMLNGSGELRCHFRFRSRGMKVVKLGKELRRSHIAIFSECNKAIEGK